MPEQEMTHEIEHEQETYSAASQIGKLVLIVEDDESIGDVLLQVVTQETRHRAHLVTDGFKALAFVETVTPDLLILDYQLPRMSGLELYDRLQLRTELARIPTIMMSARLPLQELTTRKILGMHKPIDLDDFLQVLERLLA